MTPDPPLLSIAEVAQLCHVHRETIRRWVKAGRLTPVPLPGRTVRFRTEDVNELFGREQAAS